MQVFKIFLFSFLLLHSSLIFPQISERVYIKKFSPNISIYQAYFNAERIDSAFVLKYSLKAITVNEAVSENGTLVYSKPIIKNTFDKSGKSIHVENNSWHANGGASRYHHNYGDSVIFVQHEVNYRNDTLITEYRTLHRKLIINDTLSHSYQYRYYFDSLISYKDLGIHDSEALNRKRVAERKARLEQSESSFKKEESINGIITVEKLEPKEYCILPSELHFEKNKFNVIKDTLNRIIQVDKLYLDIINSKHYYLPYESVLINYYQNTPFIKDCKSYKQTQRSKFLKLIEIQSDKKITFPIYHEPENISYSFVAEQFIQPGIPLKVTINEGTKTITYAILVEFW